MFGMGSKLGKGRKAAGLKEKPRQEVQQPSPRRNVAGGDHEDQEAACTKV